MKPQTPKKSPAVKHERAEQLQQLYGVEFPDDFFEFWKWHNQLPTEIASTIHDGLGIALVGPFDVLAGRFDDVELRYPAVLHWRYQYDPPEFFTVFTGDMDGLHWGYWFDDPQRLSPVVSAWYAADGPTLWVTGGTLFEAIESHVDEQIAAMHENIKSDPDEAEDYRTYIEELSKLKKALPDTSATPSRTPTNMTPDRMGVVIPPNAGESGKWLLRGKQLWARGGRQRFDNLEEAYDGLDRAPLAAVVRAHKKYPQLPSLDILEYGIGDYHSMDEALAEPQKVRNLTVGNAGLESLPDLSTLTELVKLSLWGNALSDLPASLAKCKKLTSINLHRNHLTTIPDVLYELPNLETLRLSGNKISSAGKELGRLKKLKELFLSGNPIPDADRDSIRRALPETKVFF